MKVRLPDLVAIGRIEKAHGIKGDVRVKPITDYPPRFKNLNTVIAEPPNGDVEELEISRVLVRENVIYLHFKGIDSREQAQALKGALLNIKREEVLPLEEGEFYHFEVVGFAVKTVSGEILGNVYEVLDMPANAVLVVKNDDQEHLIPVIRDVIEKIDKENQEIIIRPIEGLLETKN